MRVAIVGGTGNISTSVIAKLLEAGHEVTAVNRGLAAAVPDGVRLLKGDRHDLEWFVPAMRRERFDAAIDMICFTPDEARASLEGFREVGHFIQTSTVTTVGETFEWMPVTEDIPMHPSFDYPVNKIAADNVFLEAFYREGFPVTIIKPSTTYGPRRLLRQTGIDTSWVTRIRQGRPIIKVGDGRAIHHFLHVDDAAPAFVAPLGRARTFGQIYFMVNPQHTTWEQWHEAAMSALGREVEQVGVPLDTLLAIDEERFRFAKAVFSHNLLFSAEKLRRDVPEFAPAISAEEGLKQTFEYLDANGLVEDSPVDAWEDRILAAQLDVRKVAI